MVHEPERLQDGARGWFTGYRSGERITLCIGEEGTKSQTYLVSSRDGTYFHYVADWLGTFPWVVGFV